MKAEELQEHIKLGEQPGVEFKSAHKRTDKAGFAKVVRAMLAMANRQDGGLVIVGVREDDSTGLVLEGLSKEALKTWSNELVADAIAPYADPFVDFELEEVEADSKTCVVIKVYEFEETPVLCKKDGAQNSKGKPILRAGACYVRSIARRPESVEVPSHIDMRKLLDRATDKALRRFMGRLHSAGITFAPRPPPPSDDDLFESELGDLA